MLTPWGDPYSAVTILDGLIHFTTPSHGGYWVTPSLYDKMPDNLKACSNSKDNWFEDHTSWCGVVLHWHELFDHSEVASARRTYDLVYGIKHPHD